LVVISTLNKKNNGRKMHDSVTKSLPSKPWISAIYRKNFKPQIFTDITTPDKQSYSPDTGKKAQVWKCTNFDAGLYDITGL
jgi:hypothetical protein